ncbi:MAG: histidine kinase internal region [Acidobacteria bacterium]|nr:histidine kinase internal region [Acidobacteriota bacterium]
MLITQRRLFWLLQLAGWGLFWAAMLLAGLGQWPLGSLLARKSSLALIGFAITLALRLPVRKLRDGALPLPVGVALAVASSFPAAAVWMALHNYVAAVDARGAAVARQLFPDFTNTIYYAFVLTAWSLLYFGVPAAIAQRADRERLRDAEALATRARLAALRLQLNPHFLFNTLNAISTLVTEGRGAEANRMIGRLSGFLRLTLDAPERDEIPLTDEIDFARQYLDIEQSRFGERLHVTIDVAEGARDALVPPLILQPLVENAVRHAILPREEGGTIAISASRHDGWLRLAVDDDGTGADETNIRPAIGLTNTRERLQHLYGSGSELLFSRSAHGGLAVSIRLPYREAEA